MKKIILSVLALLPATLFAQTEGFVLKGKVGSLNAPAKAYLREIKNGKMVTDSTVLRNGYFEFRGPITDPIEAGLIISHDGSDLRNIKQQDGLEVYLEKNIIEINTPDSIKYVIIKGSQVNADNRRLQAAMKSITDEFTKLAEDSKSASPEQLKSKEFAAQLRAKAEKIMYVDRKAVLKEFIKNNPQSFVSLNALKDYAQGIPDVPEVTSLYNSLAPSVKETATGKEFGEFVKNLAKADVGKLAPDFTQTDTAGHPVKLSSFRGKYVLLDFWASWCVPCRAENPNVVKAYAEYHPKGLDIISVSLDLPNGKEKWLKAIHADGLKWTQVSDLKSFGNEVAVLYGIHAIPQNFLIGPDGKIIAKNLQGAELNQKLREIFKN